MLNVRYDFNNLMAERVGDHGRSVGALLYLLEMQSVYAGELYDINAFEQPGVELGKNFTYGLMGRKGHDAKRKEVKQASKPNAKLVVQV